MVKVFKPQQLTKDIVTVVFTFTILGVLVFPFVWIILTSIRPADRLFATDFQFSWQQVTLNNYTVLFQSGFFTYVWNSLMVSIPATIIATVLSFITAYVFSRRNFPYRNELLIIAVFSQLFPFIVLTTPVYLIYAWMGLVNSRISLIITYVAISIPFSIYLLLGYLDSIPLDMDEAALIDGSSTFNTIFRVIFPIALPGVATTAIYTFIRSWNDFLFALTLITDNDLKTIPIGLANFFGQYTTQWDLVMTASVLATLPTLIIFFFLQRQLVSGLAAGGVKQ